jgi:hypothetical protein
VSITLANRPKARVLGGVRVPCESRRAITQCRRARSAVWFVSGHSGCSSTVQIASQSLRNSRAKAWVFSCPASEYWRPNHWKVLMRAAKRSLKDSSGVLPVCRVDPRPQVCEQDPDRLSKQLGLPSMAVLG